VALIGRAIALNEPVPEFHYNIGLALWALDRRDEASRHWARAVKLNPNFAEARLNLGNALREERRFDEAIVQHSVAVQLQPNSALAHNSLGLSLAKAGRDADAIDHYRRAIALQPAFIDTYLNLAMAHSDRGETGEALALTMHSIGIRETPENKTLFVGLVSGISIDRDEPELRRFLIRALEQDWTAPNAIATGCLGLIRHGPARGPITRAAQIWPARLPAAELFGPAGLAAFNDPLLLALMSRTVVGNPDLEKFLAACRFTVLETAGAAPSEDDAPLQLACALARQCFINEYVFAETAAEAALLQQVRDGLAAALAAGSPVSVLWPVALAAYRPLHMLPEAQALLERPWPASVHGLFEQQVHEPLRELELRATIPALTPIADEVSRKVRAQYEEMPYPRWITAAPATPERSLAWYLRNQFPLAPLRDLPKREGLDVLIAGCGTGQHPIETARRFPTARVLAIDLSLSSLSYAKRKTQALGLANIDYAQADLLLLGAHLGSAGRSFDLIESSGVLHHLADPMAGWRVLLSLLRPGGVMHIGLYSALARADIRAARAFVAERGYGRTVADIRQFRQDLRSLPEGSPVRNVMNFSDFYTVSECRDLIFHVQEHQLSIPEIKTFLHENALTFLGFDNVPPQGYRSRITDDPAMTDLDRWHQFETENPLTFIGMYQFWVQKAG
jgi:SAM-dependent methyltransferase